MIRMLTVGMLWAALFAACGSSDNSASKTRVASGRCEPRDAKTTVDAIQPISEDFSDAYSRASSASRISLSPVIRDLQEIRTRMKRLELPACAARLQGFLTDAYDAAAEAFLAFQAQESDASVRASLDTATTNLTSANQLLTEFRVDAVSSD